MDKDKSIVTVELLDKSYTIKCINNDSVALKKSAQALNKKLCETRDQYQINNTIDLALIVALNLTHELLHQDTAQQDYRELMSAQLKQLNQKVQNHLNDNTYPQQTSLPEISESEKTNT